MLSIENNGKEISGVFAFNFSLKMRSERDEW